MNSYVIGCGNLPTIEKVNTSRLDYSFDFSKWLTGINDTIASYTVTGEAGIAVETPTQVSGIVTAFVSGGVAGNSYKVTCEIVTTDGRIDSRTIVLKVVAAR